MNRLDKLKLSIEEVLLYDDPLDQFTKDYCESLRGDVAYAMLDGIGVTNHGMSLTLFDIYPFKAELFIFRPNEKLVTHYHPNIDSMIVYVAGDLYLEVDGKEVTDRKLIYPDEIGAVACSGANFRIRPGVPHGGSIGPRGGAFLTLQRWMNDDLPPTNAQHDWVGVDGSTKG